MSVRRKKYPLEKINEKTIGKLVKDVRADLNLNSGIWKDMDGTLVLLAFTHPSALQYSLLPANIVRNMKKYEATDYEKFEFLGDRVLDMIISDWLVRKTWKYATPKLYSKLKSDVVKNSALECYMMTRDLCDKYVGFNVGKKTCADIFEAIIGVLYYYLTHDNNEAYTAFFYIEQWLIQTFDLERRLDNAIQGKSPC